MKRALEICGGITAPPTKKSSIYVIVVSKREKRKFRAEKKTFKEISENVPNLVRELVLSIQAQ